MNTKLTSRTSLEASAPPGQKRDRPGWEDRIARRARSLWEAYGKPVGRDEELWLEAERELRRAAMADESRLQSAHR